MPAIIDTKLINGESVSVTPTVLDGSTDTLVYSGTEQVLHFENGSGGTLTANLLGAGVSGTKKCSGGGDVDLSAGFDIEVLDGESKVISLHSIRDYLGAQGNTVNITGGTLLAGFIVTGS